MNKSHFFAFLRRMRFIRRWGLMRNTIPENIQEHSIEVAWVAHQLAILRNTYFGGHVDANKCAVIAIYHDVSEIFTGDLPTPVKYFDAHMREVYGHIERSAQVKLVETLPPEMQDLYSEYIIDPEENELWPLVKAADTLSAYMKCVAETTAGNGEFKEALATIEKKLRSYDMPEVEKFIDLYIPSLSLSLDQLNYSMDKE